MDEPRDKQKISLTIDADVLDWLRLSAETESVSISFLVNRFCMISKEALDSKIRFPDRRIIGGEVKKRGFKDVA